MNRIRLVAIIAVASLLTAACVFAQSSTGSGQAGTQGNTQVNGNASAPDANASAGANASADASAQADVERLRKSIESRAAKASAKARARAAAQLELSAKSADQSAETRGADQVASRLGAEFGMTSDAVTSERSQLDASWGNLMIAHTLAANSKTDVSAAQLIELKKSGMGWGEIAAGLGYDLGSAVSATRAESRVVAGDAKSSGHVAVINGEGAKAGVSANASLGAATRATHAKAGAGVGVGAGIKIGH